MEDARRQDVAPCHTQEGRGVLWGGFFHDACHVHQTFTDRGTRHDAVAPGMFFGYFLNGDDGCAPFAVLLDHLRQNRLAVHHQIVRQQHRKGFVADEFLTAQHRMAQAQRLRLAHVNAFHVVGLDAANHVQQLLFAGLLQCHFQLKGHVEMVFDGALVPAGDKNHLTHTRRIRFFNRVLNQRLVHHWQHFFGLRFGSGQKTRAQTCDGEDCFSD